MQSNLSVNNIQPSFQAKVAKHFIDDAHKLFNYKHIKNDMKINFDEKVTEFANFGYDDYYIKYVKKDIDGKRFHQLIAVGPDMADTEGVVLTSKDQFRKVIEKFTHINKYEFTKKMENLKFKNFNIKPSEK